MPARSSSFRLFRIAGIDVYLHWWWFLVALYEVRGNGRYSSIAWNAAEYLALFAIVLTHEFGHALACRSVGGQANRIMLWPLGGVAYVSPPERPGATLWSIAAGPLVNVALIPVLWGALYAANVMHLGRFSPDALQLIEAVLYIDIGLLLFNILPVYPLDGGQILRSLLWFVLGRGRSLMVATVVGILGVVALVVYAFYSESLWMGLMAAYLLMNCWTGLRTSSEADEGGQAGAAAGCGVSAVRRASSGGCAVELPQLHGKLRSVCGGNTVPAVRRCTQQHHLPRVPHNLTCGGVER